MKLRDCARLSLAVLCVFFGFVRIVIQRAELEFGQFGCISRLSFHAEPCPVNRLELVDVSHASNELKELQSVDPSLIFNRIIFPLTGEKGIPERWSLLHSSTDRNRTSCEPYGTIAIKIGLPLLHLQAGFWQKKISGLHYLECRAMPKILDTVVSFNRDL